MKKLLLLSLFLISAFSQAQTVTIPDANFKNSLTNPDAIFFDLAFNQAGDRIVIDANSDGEIQVSEALTVYKLNVGGSGITNLTGLEAFQNLRELDCSHNNLSTFPYFNMPNLQVLSCSNNQLTSMVYSGLPNLKSLNVNNNQLHVFAVSNLPHLEDLLCQINAMTSLALAGLPALKYLECNSNLLTSLDFSGLTTLEGIRCDNNPLGTINVSMLPNLKTLGVRECQLTSLNMSGITNLESLDCYSNLLTGTLDLSAHSNLEVLAATGCEFTGLNISGLQHLSQLGFNGNNLTSIDLSTNTGLELLQIAGNHITNLDLSALVNLKHLDCSGNQMPVLEILNSPVLENLSCSNMGLVSLVTAPIPNLRNFNVSYNNLTALDLPKLTSASYFNVSHNHFPTLDLSDFYQIGGIICSDNPELTAIFMKNGSSEHNLEFNNLPNLAYICTDEMNLPLVQTVLNFAGNPNCMLNTYCSMDSAGDFDSISGTVRFDANMNGCDNTDPIMPSVRINIEGGSNVGSAFSNTSGFYGFGVYDEYVTITPAIENPTYFTMVPESQSFVFEPEVDYTETLDFCVTPNGIHHDVEVLLIPVSEIRPGFDADFKLIYRNKGNQMASGTLTFGFDDAIFDFVSSVPAASQSPSLLQYDFADLLPFESREIAITLNLNGPMETSPVNNGDLVDLNASISIPNVDEQSEDNSFALHAEVIGSLDPNDKHCLQGDTVNPSQIGKYLHYQINFENTGTAYAENIIVRDAIDATKFDINTLQFISSSHPAKTRISGSKVEFVFENINLQVSEHGYVVFKIKTLNTLATNATVSNKADIFFDYNFPVETNTATTTFSLLATDQFAVDNSVSIYPNPAGDFVKVKCKESIKSIELYDVQGRIVYMSIVEGKEISVDLSQYYQGIYHLRVQTDKAVQSVKIVKK